MRLHIYVFAAMIGVAGIFAASSSATPAPTVARVSPTRSQPVAGQKFIGYTIVPLAAGTRVTVKCSTARVGGVKIPGRMQRFYSRGVEGPAAVTCGWLIPIATRGTLLAQAPHVTVYPNGVVQRDAHVAWRVR
jgi:hypothetical protein